MNNTLIRHAITCMIFTDYKHANNDELLQILHAKTGLVSYTLSDFMEIYNKYKEEYNNHNNHKEEYNSHKEDYNNQNNHYDEGKDLLDFLSKKYFNNKKIESLKCSYVESSKSYISTLDDNINNNIISNSDSTKNNYNINNINNNSNTDNINNSNNKENTNQILNNISTKETNNSINTNKISGSKIKSNASPEQYENIQKKKKNKKFFREMSPRQREIDNDLDILVENFYVNEDLIFEEKKGAWGSPIIAYYSEIDIQFMEIMKNVLKICRIPITTNLTHNNHNNHNIIHNNHNTHFNEEKMEENLEKDLNFIEKYFTEYFGIETDPSVKGKLANSISNIMRHLQKRMFDLIEKREYKELNLLNFYKNRLFNLYNYYKK